jgi:hypothetical protein
MERSSSFLMVLRLLGLVLLYYRRPVFISHLETGDSVKELTDRGWRGLVTKTPQGIIVV